MLRAPGVSVEYLMKGVDVSQSQVIVVNQQKWDSWGAEKICCYEEEKASSLTVLL